MNPASDIKTLHTAEAIALRIRGMAEEIAAQYGKTELLVVPLLRGSFIFAADLVRAMSCAGMAPQIDFLTVSSYGNAMTSSQEVKIYRDMDEEVEGRTVLLVDDILESGRTLHYARNLMKKRGAASVRIAVLLHKPGKEVMEIVPDFIGFTVPDKFVIGYGLDYANRYRELPYIGYIEG